MFNLDYVSMLIITLILIIIGLGLTGIQLILERNKSDKNEQV